ncbi:MAG TPA: glycoside hydrolase family 88 protein [Verrucomicrobiae bacterium]|jgi:unsaturated rhamnogalacturonyl hydrolase
MKKDLTRSTSWLLHSSFFILTSCWLVSCATPPASAPTFSGATPIEWSQRLANPEITRLGTSLNWQPSGNAKWDYTAGLFALSLLKLDKQVHTPDYVSFAENAIGSFIEPDGAIRTYHPEEYQLDALNPGRTVLALWQATHADKYKNAAVILRSQLDSQPRTSDGGFWHKQRYPNQMWLDGIYMGVPFYAGCAAASLPGTSPADFADVAKQIHLIDAHTFDPKTGLNYHGWDAARIQPWANPLTGCSSNFWGRAEGWYAMALVDVLDDLPANHPARAEVIAIFQKTCAGIVKYQDAKTGLWWQVIDQGNRPGNYLEATASAMFVYALAKGINHGYLPRELTPVAVRGFGGIIKNLMESDSAGGWSLTHCCAVAGLGGSPSGSKPRDGSFDYYAGEPVIKNDLKGIGPFILAGIELQQLTRTNIQ